MAEGWARVLRPDDFEAYSAGVMPNGINVDAVRVMAEAGVDLSAHWSKRVDELVGIEFDVVVTVCDHARETCPVFPAQVEIIHRSFDDPPALAIGATNEDERLAPYRRVRDEIRDFVQRLPASLPMSHRSQAKQR